jgi:hypothetical protein
VPIFSVVVASLVMGQAAPSDLSRYVYPLARPIRCPRVTLDVTDYPEGKEWGEAARGLVQTWFTHVSQLLATDGMDPITRQKRGERFAVPREIKLVIKRNIDPPAYAQGGTITVKGPWITAHPDDLGLIIHEMTHVIQAYPDSDKTPGWLVEGIADYIRWWRYEPELHATKGRTKIDPAKSNYTDAYRTTAVWLAWCTQTYDRRLVPALDKAMRDREDPMPIFARLTGKTADKLWKQFVTESAPR